MKKALSRNQREKSYYFAVVIDEIPTHIYFDPVESWWYDMKIARMMMLNLKRILISCFDYDAFDDVDGDLLVVSQLETPHRRHSFGHPR